MSDHKYNQSLLAIVAVVAVVAIISLMIGYKAGAAKSDIAGEAIWLKSGEIKADNQASIKFETGANIEGVGAEGGAGLRFNVKDPITKDWTNMKLDGNGDLRLSRNLYLGNNRKSK